MKLQYILGFIISLGATLVAYPLFIKFMKKLNLNQQVSEYAIEEFKSKEKTPPMGGVLFVLVPIITLLIVDFKAFTQTDVLLVLLAFVTNALIGFYDDYLILVRGDNIGFTTGKKFILEVILSIGIGIVWFISNNGTLSLNIPFITNAINIGWLYFIIIVVMMAGVSNAVNLTDGMDGLAGGTVTIALIPYIIFALKQGNVHLATLLIVVAASLIGFLFYNVSPARIFMGDVGSLSLGALLASSAIVLGKELILIIIGGVFVINVVSVILQVGSVKLRGKRIFRYTPIHYSFSLGGTPEKKVVRGFWIFGIILAIIGTWIGLM